MNERTPWTDDGRLRVNGWLAIPAHELTIRATRAGGPGGQHVNTSSTRVEVTWGVATSAALDDATRERLRAKLGGKLDSTGTLRVVAADTRSQQQNRALALERLAATVRNALVVPKARKATKPSKASKARRLDEKKKRSAQKQDRRYRGDD